MTRSGVGKKRKQPEYFAPQHASAHGQISRRVCPGLWSRGSIASNEALGKSARLEDEEGVYSFIEQRDGAAGRGIHNSFQSHRGTDAVEMQGLFLSAFIQN